jgi:uncharacterized protein YaaR (DUF327 family)
MREIQMVFYKILEKENPKLLEVVRELVLAGEDPERIADKVEEIAGKEKLLPGMVEGAAHYIKAQQAH